MNESWADLGKMPFRGESDQGTDHLVPHWVSQILELIGTKSPLFCTPLPAGRDSTGTHPHLKGKTERIKRKAG